MNVKIFVIADIHLGVLDPQYQWENLKEHFLSHIETEKPNIIVVNGDIMHEKCSVNSTTASVFQMFIDALTNTGSIVLIVEGTNTHDDNQIKIFSHRINEKFRIYNKVTVDNILGMKILFIPEEYMVDPDEYYSSYFSKGEKYDFVFGHGMMNHIAYVSKKKPIHRKLTAPMWDYDKHFKNIVYCKINFGHIHTPSKLGKFSYNGSFGRYNHSEEEPKGFTIYDYDIDKKSLIKETYIENTGAKIFKTILEKDLPILRDDLVKKLKKVVEKSHKLRIRIDREITTERLSDLVSFSKSNLNTTIDKLHDRKTNKLAKGDDKLSGSEMVVNKYENMDIIEATIEFVLENRGIKLNKERILKIINSDDKS